VDLSWETETFQARQISLDIHESDLRQSNSANNLAMPLTAVLEVFWKMTKFHENSHLKKSKQNVRTKRVGGFTRIFCLTYSCDLMRE